MNSSGDDGGNAATPSPSSSIVASFLSTGTPIPESASAALLETICQSGSAESEALVSSGSAARLCDVIVDAANEKIAAGEYATSSTSSSNSSLLTSLRILRNLCASGSRAGDVMAPTGVAMAAAVLAAASAAAAAVGGGTGARERGEEGGGGAADAAADAAASSANADAHQKVSIAAAQLLANLFTCSAAGAEAVWREAVVVAGFGGKGIEVAAGAAASPSSPTSASSSSSFLAAASRQGGPRVAGPVASAADAALLRQTRKAAEYDDDGGGGGDDAVQLLCSSPLLAAVVDGLRLESGSLHHDAEEERKEEKEGIENPKREKDAAATAIAARAVARLLRSLSFLPSRGGGLSLALEALKKGPPAKRERRETALRLLGHVIAEEGCFGGLGFERGNDKTAAAAPAAPSEEQGHRFASSSSTSLPFESFASAILEALDCPSASPGEVEACLALLREVAARDDEEERGSGSKINNSSSSPSSSSSSLSSVVAALVRAGLVPRLLDRIAGLPPVRGQEEAEAESDARSAQAGGQGGGEEGREKSRRRRLPRYPEERADAVAVLANALHRRKYVVDSLLECEGGAELLLAQCGAVGAEEAGEGEWRRREKDEERAMMVAAAAAREGGNLSSPSRRDSLPPPTVGAFAREWALWALRNLTEASEEARKLLSDLRPVRAVPSEELERAGLRLELDERSGKFELRKLGE